MRHIHYRITLLLLLFSSSASAQDITLSDLFRYRDMPFTSVQDELLTHSWAQRIDNVFTKHDQQISFRDGAELMVRYFTKDEAGFNKRIRDSLEAYGYVPDTADQRWHNDVYASNFRWKSMKDATDMRRILIKYRDTIFRGKMVTISIFEGRR